MNLGAKSESGMQVTRARREWRQSDHLGGAGESDFSHPEG